MELERHCNTCKYVRPFKNPNCIGCIRYYMDEVYNTVKMDKWEPKETEFIKKYEIQQPKLMTEDLMSGCTGSVSAIIEKMCAVSVETHESILIDEIIKIAKESGITDLYLLNKTTIAEALSKQIPKPLTMIDNLWGCPRCRYDIKCEDYCPGCGQKILMDSETDYPVREE